MHGERREIGVVGRETPIISQTREVSSPSPPYVGQRQLRLPFPDYNLDFWGARRGTFAQAGACLPSSQPQPIGMTKRDKVEK